METNYNLPQPYVRYRNKMYPDNLCAGDVVAYCKLNYRGEYSTGIMIICERNMFLVATNWSYGGLWYNDMIDFFERTNTMIFATDQMQNVYDVLERKVDSNERENCERRVHSEYPVAGEARRLQGRHLAL